MDLYLSSERISGRAMTSVYVPDRINPIWMRWEASGAIADYNRNEGEGGPLNAYRGDAHPTRLVVNNVKGTGIGSCQA